MFNATKGKKCSAPRHGFKVSYKSESEKTWHLHTPYVQPLSPNPTSRQQPSDNTEESFLGRLIGNSVSESTTDTTVLHKLATAIHCCTATGGSDGSLKNGEMMLGWALESNMGENVA